MGSGSSVQKSTIEPIKVIMTGLDTAGKHTILEQLTHYRNAAMEDIMPGTGTHCTINDYYFKREADVIDPDSGFQVESLLLPWKKLEIICWDAGDHPEDIRSRCRHYYKQAKAVIFVVDSNDWDRIDNARVEMHRIMNEDELKDIPLLVLANKRDLIGIMNLSGMKECLGMYPFSGRRRRWRVQGICASQDLGIAEGFDWITSGCPDLLKTKYDMQLLRSLYQKGRASMKNIRDEKIKNILLFICNQPSEICILIEIYLGVVDNRVTGIEYVF